MMDLGKLSPAWYTYTTNEMTKIYAWTSTECHLTPPPTMPGPIQDNSSNPAVSLFNSIERLTWSFAQNLKPGDSNNFTSDNLGETVH